MIAVHRYCAGCADERVFEQPPCLDGHGADCPELACVDCGYALIFPADFATLDTPGPSVAHPVAA